MKNCHNGPAQTNVVGSNYIGDCFVIRKNLIIKDCAQMTVEGESLFTGLVTIDDLQIKKSLKTDTIDEYTDGNGVEIDGVIIKDNGITADTICANTSVLTDVISEKTPNAGITIDNILLKDGTITALCIQNAPATTKVCTNNDDTVDIIVDNAQKVKIESNGAMEHGLRQTTGSPGQIGTGVVRATGADSFASGQGTQNIAALLGKADIDGRTGVLDSTASGQAAHVEGIANVAAGIASHAEGGACQAIGDFSHAEGLGGKATGKASHVEGDPCLASGDYSHAEGQDGTASGFASHTEGRRGVASGSYAHCEGNLTTASAVGAHAEGLVTYACGNGSHAEGHSVYGGGLIFGSITSEGLGSHAEGFHSGNSVSNVFVATGRGAHVEGCTGELLGIYLNAGTIRADGDGAHAEGFALRDGIISATGNGSHCEGYVDNATNLASGLGSHSEGSGTTASGNFSHAAGQNATAGPANNTWCWSDGTSFTNNIPGRFAIRASGQVLINTGEPGPIITVGHNNRTSWSYIPSIPADWTSLPDNMSAALDMLAAGGKLTDSNILVGNGSNVATGVPVSGDASILNTGLVTIESFQNGISLNGTTASFNVGVGVNTLNSITSGTNNTMIGNTAGSTLITGSNVSCVGNNAQPSSISASNEITLGDSSITTVRSYGTWTMLSDKRDKTNINPLSAGIDFISKLKPVEFDWNMRDKGKIDVADIGFIAQDLQKIQNDMNINIPGLVHDVNPEKLEISPSKLIPVLVKAVQDLHAELQSIKK